MNDTDEFAGDLYDLWKAGNISLPLAATIYLNANKAIAATSEYAGVDEYAIFTRTNETGEGGLITGAGDVYPLWSEARDLLQTAFAQTSSNFLDAGNALCQAADDYAAADTDAAEEFQKKIDHYRELAEEGKRRSEEQVKPDGDPILPEPTYEEHQ